VIHPVLRHPVRFLRDHRFTARHASEYLDGTLDDAGRARVERHARLCPGCHELLASLRRTLAALRELRATAGTPPESTVASATIARLRREG